jgi:hypothetical protein
VQVNLYNHFGFQGSADAEITYYFRDTATSTTIPVPYDKDLALQAAADLLAVQAAIQQGQPLPVPDGHEPFSYPCQMGQIRCPFWRHCWGRSAAPPQDAQVLVPDLAASATDYLRLRDTISATEDHLKILKAQRETMEAGFSAVLDEHQARRLIADGIHIWRTPVPGRKTVDQAAAQAAGLDLTPYLKESAGYVRWYRADKRSQDPSAS